MHHRRPTDRITFALGAIAGIMLAVFLFLQLWRPPAPEQRPLPKPQAPMAANELPVPSTPHDPVHVLVLGVDERRTDAGRSDSMMLIRFEPGGAVRYLALPRDTLVKIAGHGHDKLNAAYAYGGPDLAKQTVADLLGLPVHYYVKVNLKGFRHLVDLMGGVTYTVEKRMRYLDPYDDLVIDLRPGRQVLDGAKAEQYVRYRYDALGDDVSRIHRQQQFLRAAAAQMLTPSKLPLLPQFLYTGSKYVDTDVPLTAQLKLAEMAYRAHQQGALVADVLPGRGEYVQGISFYLADPKALHQLVTTWQTGTRLP